MVFLLKQDNVSGVHSAKFFFAYWSAGFGTFLQALALASHWLEDLLTVLYANGWENLKVPKREIFNCSDFPDFYTIKSLRVGDIGVKI